MAAGRAPRTGTKVPSNDHSPSETVFSQAYCAVTPIVAISASAIGKLKFLPSLSRSADDRFTVIHFEDNAIDIDASALRARS